jgi:hypothetical protein
MEEVSIQSHDCLFNEHLFGTAQKGVAKKAQGEQPSRCLKGMFFAPCCSLNFSAAHSDGRTHCAGSLQKIRAGHVVTYPAGPPGRKQ